MPWGRRNTHLEQRCLQMIKKGIDLEEVPTRQNGQVIPYVKGKEKLGGRGEYRRKSLFGPIGAQSSYLSDA